MTFRLKEHRGFVALGVLVIMFLAVKYDYVKKEDVSDGFHAAVDLTKQLGNFAEDIWTGGNNDRARKIRADERLDKHLRNLQDSLSHKQKRKE